MSSHSSHSSPFSDSQHGAAEPAITAARDRGQWARLVLFVLFLGNIAMFIAIWLKGTKTDPINFWSNIYFIIPLVGAWFGFQRLYRARNFRFRRHRFVPALFCSGLMLWAIGCAIWLFYNVVLHTNIPYPSWADIPYFGCVICWAAGLLRLYQLTESNLLEVLRAAGPISVGALVGLISIILWAHGKHLGPADSNRTLLKLILDVSFSLLDVLNLTLLAGLAFGDAYKKLNLETRRRVALLAGGYLLLALGNITFSVGTSVPEDYFLAYYNGGLSDLLFSCAMYLLGVGLTFVPIEKSTGSCLLARSQSNAA